MIRAVTFTNYLGDSIRLDLARPEESGFIIKSVTGLGPGKANINTTEIATNDGSLFNSSRMPSRNIVISLAYMWKDSIEDVRQLSYKYFPIKKKLTMLIETDNRQAEIEGYVESNDPTIFSKDEGSDISIVCPNPFFYSAGKDGINTTIFYGVEALFEFPFSNESLKDPLLEMGEIKNETEQVVKRRRFFGLLCRCVLLWHCELQRRFGLFWGSSGLPGWLIKIAGPCAPFIFLKGPSNHGRKNL